jgi:putative restriction endonuclease
MTTDIKIQMEAFDWLSKQTSIQGDLLPRTLLAEGFSFEGRQIPLVSPKGIFKPKILDIPLTIATTPENHYDDEFYKDKFLIYHYRGSNPNHPDVVGLRKAMRMDIPLIYFLGVSPGKYLAVWPVYIVADDPKNFTFTVIIDDAGMFDRDNLVMKGENANKCVYMTSLIKSRLFKRSFRVKVLEAYRTQCALCRLPHVELLDAAHIIHENEPGCTSTVDNGIALCKLHHAAFDSFFIGISPDYIVEVRPDILGEDDGPMLLHGLKEFNKNKIMLPVSKSFWPNKDFLERRHQKFINAL